MPAIPHISLCRRLGRAARCRRPVCKLPEPELQHDQAPQPVAVVLTAVAVLAPEARDGVMIEDAAVAQPAVGEQIVDHRRQRASKPCFGRSTIALGMRRSSRRRRRYLLRPSFNFKLVGTVAANSSSL